MLCGLPGSGETSLPQSLIDTNTDWISSDGIRRELYDLIVRWLKDVKEYEP